MRGRPRCLHCKAAPFSGRFSYYLGLASIERLVSKLLGNPIPWPLGDMLAKDRPTNGSAPTEKLRTESIDKPNACISAVFRPLSLQ